MISLPQYRTPPITPSYKLTDLPQEDQDRIAALVPPKKVKSSEIQITAPNKWQRIRSRNR